MRPRSSRPPTRTRARPSPPPAGPPSRPWSGSARSSRRASRPAGPAGGGAFAAAGRAACPAMERLGALLLEDVGVPVPSLPTLVHGIRAIAAERDTPIVVVAHAGDGNTHPIIAYPAGDAS